MPYTNVGISNGSGIGDTAVTASEVNTQISTQLASAVRDYNFSSVTERDTHYTSNPTHLTTNTFITVKTGTRLELMEWTGTDEPTTYTAATDAVNWSVKGTMGSESVNLLEKVKQFGGNFDASLSTTVHDDSVVTIFWDQSNKVMKYTWKTTGWHDVNVYKLDGDRERDVRGNAGDVDDGAGTFHFTDNGNLDNDFVMEVYGARASYMLMAENYNAANKLYMVDVMMGEDDNCGYLVRVVNYA